MVSNIGDGWKDQLPYKHPSFWPIPVETDSISRTEFEALRQELIELKNLLKAAQLFDRATGQPDCEMDEKVKLIKALAKLVGVDLGDVFAASPKKP